MAFPAKHSHRFFSVTNPGISPPSVRGRPIFAHHTPNPRSRHGEIYWSRRARSRAGAGAARVEDAVGGIHADLPNATEPESAGAVLRSALKSAT